MRWAPVRALGMALLGVLLAAGAAVAGPRVRWTPADPRQGDIAMVFVGGAAGARDVAGQLGGRALSFFPYGEGWAALAGIDMSARPGRLEWRVAVVDAAGDPWRAAGAVVVGARRFAVERPAGRPPGARARVPAGTPVSEDRLRALADAPAGERLWAGRFTRPVGTHASALGFGVRDTGRRPADPPHAWVDFDAPRGTPVVAANRGRVATVGEGTGPGRFVVLDHGLGLYTAYGPLGRVDVREGDVVERGGGLGLVGTDAAGAAGARLHWAARLRRARVNPLQLLSLPVAD